MNNEGYMLILISEAPSKIQASFKFSLFLLFVCEPKCSFAHPSEHVETEFLSIIFKKKEISGNRDGNLKKRDRTNRPREPSG
jgi:hypothetical protein